MLLLGGMKCSLLLGPDGKEARQIGDQIKTQDTVEAVIEPKPGVFALDLRLIELKGNWFVT
jgi:hypothetical protein